MTLTALLFSASCGKSMMQQGNGSSYLIVDSLQAASGATPTALSTTLASDVVTIKAGTPTVFSDPAQVVMHVAMKDTSSGVTPTDTNTITLTGYHVDYVRSDGVSAVPASFDGALTATVTTSSTTVPFVLVTAQAKGVAPLAALQGTSNHIVVVAHVTFSGHDQAGHSVTVVTTISIDFADWADPTT
jgi:hypothetical protein